MTPRTNVIRRILVAVDQSDQARWALDEAGHLARSLGAELAIIHVAPALSVDPMDVYPKVRSDLEETGAKLLRMMSRQLPAEVRPQLMLREGCADREIVAAAREWDADLIVLGTHGRGHVSRFFLMLGSVAAYVLKYAPCPVMTVSHDPAIRAPLPLAGENQQVWEEEAEDAMAGVAM